MTSAAVLVAAALIAGCNVSRQVLGTVAVGGMLAATCIACFFIPALFYMAERISGRGARIAALRKAAAAAETSAVTH